MSRFFKTILFLAMVFVVSDCQAQRFRGWLTRGTRFHRVETPSELGQPSSTHYGAIERSVPNSNSSSYGAIERRTNPLYRSMTLPNNATGQPLQSPHAGQYLSRRGQRKLPHNYDPDNWRFQQSMEKYPKYIGGFHSSFYSDLGLPTGDIGFRGNGLYWAPWQ